MSHALTAQAIADSYIAQRTGLGRISELADSNKLTKFLDALQDGCYVNAAADYSGLGYATVGKWMLRGEHEPESAYGAFRVAVKEAEAAAEAAIVKRVRAAADLPQFWAAGMTLLERRHPERWSKRQDDSQAPKIVVQIGASNSDIRVGVSLSPQVSPVLHSLSASDDSVQCPITAVMVTNGERAIDASAASASDIMPTETAIPAVESQGGALPLPLRLGGQRTPTQNKGKSISPRKKKKG